MWDECAGLVGIGDLVELWGGGSIGNSMGLLVWEALEIEWGRGVEGGGVGEALET